MGDPLSVAASILTLLGAGGAVGKFLKKVIALEHAPDILLALNNDIVDLQRVVQAVDELVQEHSRMTDKAPLDHVSESLEKVKKTLSTLEYLVSYELTVVERDGNHLRLDRSVWLRFENKVIRLREEIRANKADLCLSLTLLTNCTSLQGVIQSQALQTSVTDLEDQIRRTARNLFSQLETSEQSLRVGLEDQRQHKIALHQIRTSLDEDHVHGRSLNNRVQALEVLLREVGDRQQVQTQSLQELKGNVIQYHERDRELSDQPRAIEASLTQPLGPHRPQIELLPDIEERQLYPSLNSRRRLGTPRDQATALCLSGRESLSNTIPIKLARNSCDSACGCVCHQRNQFKSPRSLNALLGSLFVGYQASPWSTQTCSNSGCRQRSKKLTYVYAFPKWFLARILVVDMAYSQSRGPEWCLRVMRVRSSETGFYSQLLNNMYLDTEWIIHQLKRLLNDGEVSVVDVDTEGFTILHSAFSARNFCVAELLIRCGADLYYQNDWGRSAFVKAWEIFLVEPSLTEGKTFLRDQLWDQSQLDLLGFSQLQKAYFGLSGVSYRIALSRTSRSAIDEVNATGRTILSWASQKGDDTTVAELLACGADPNITDSSGMSCLHYAVTGYSEKCVRLLLASKAELEVKDSDGQTPLAYAATKSFGGFKVLLEFGADMETRNLYGWRPIHSAVTYDQVQNVRHFMHAGADMFARTSSGYTALDIAIFYNTHSSLRALLETSARRKIDIPSDVDLSEAAWYADQETLEILHLAVSKGFHLRGRMEDEQKTDVFETAEWRRDSNQDWSEKALLPLDADPSAWFHSFKLLVQAIKSGQSRISEDSDDERQSQSGNDAGEESPGIENENEGEDEESWEDARES